MKKSLLALSLAVSSVAVAQANTSAFNGFYLGATTGLDLRSTETKVEASDYKKSKRKSGLVYGAYTGYGRNTNGFYLGAELSVGSSTTNKDTSHTVTAVDVKTKYNRGVVFGLAPRVGAVFAKDFLGYVKLGLEYSRDKGESSVAGTKTSSKNKNKVVFAPGLGLEKAFGQILTRIEYTYNCGSKVSIGDDRVSYKENRIQAGVAYRF